MYLKYGQSQPEHAYKARAYKKQVRIHDKTSRVLLGRGSNAQKLLKEQEKLKKVNGGWTDGPTDRQSDL